MLNWISLISGYDNSRHTEFLQNAEKEQLVRIALEGKEPTDPFYYGALAAVGRQLSNWGEGLQERYGDVYESINPVDAPQPSLSREQA